MEYGVNLWAVLTSVVISVILGTLWYGPLFGKSWMHMMGITQEKMEDMKKSGQAAMRMSYGIMIVSSLITTYVLAYILKSFAIGDASSAIQFAVLVWLGFIGTIMTGIVSWEGKPWKLWLINSGYHLVNLAIASWILVSWK